jgi:hypothetical protein
MELTREDALGALGDAREALAREGRWRQGDWFDWRDVAHRIRPDGVPPPDCACLMGQIGLSYGFAANEIEKSHQNEGDTIEIRLNEFARLLAPHILALKPEGLPVFPIEDYTWDDVAAWNDHPSTRLEHVLAVLDAAIAELKRGK